MLVSFFVEKSSKENGKHGYAVRTGINSVLIEEEIIKGEETADKFRER